jgi:outer membrane lipoprotein-sorting protein
MRRLRTASPRNLALLAATVVAVALGAVGIAQAVGGATPPPAKPLDQAIYDASRAPQVEGITARIEFTNNLLPSGTLPDGSASPVLTGASGRLWLTNDGRIRLELQSENGDAQIASDGSRFSVYDATSNTAYVGTVPHKTGKPAEQRKPSLENIQDGLAKLGQAWDLSGAKPGTTADQPSYTVRIAPKDDGGLLGAAELAWDAARGVPLRAAIYAQGQKSPVLELKATDISYGKIAEKDVDATPPKGAKVTEVNPALGVDAHGRPTTVQGLANVQKHVPFTISAPDTLAGLPRRGVSLVRSDNENGALVTYGKGFGQILVFQHKAGADGKSALRLPTVNIDGATGTELATSLGTIVTFSRHGVSYTIAGSVPPLAAENAARGLS